MKMRSRKLLLLSILPLMIAGAVFMLWFRRGTQPAVRPSLPSTESPQSPPSIESSQPVRVSSQDPNAFDPALLNVGDIVASMRVESIAPLASWEPLRFVDDPYTNYTIAFVGPKTISGSYFYAERVGGWSLQVGPDSDVLPYDYTFETQARRASVCIHQSDTLPDLGRRGTGTFVIDRFEAHGTTPSVCTYDVTVVRVVAFDPEPAQ